jgi:hypothetical protein
MTTTPRHVVGQTQLLGSLGNRLREHVGPVDLPPLVEEAEPTSDVIVRTQLHRLTLRLTTGDCKSRV